MPASIQRTIVILVTAILLSPLSPARADGLGGIGDCTRQSVFWLLKDPREQYGIRDEFERFVDADRFGIPVNDTEYSLRRHLVAFCKDKEQRQELKRALLQDLKNIGRDIQARVARAYRTQTMDLDAQVYDVITIGSGPEGVVFDYNFARANPRAKHLTIEASSGIATTFNTQGFRLNSLNRPGTQNQISARGVGNQNALPGCPLQIPDFSPSAYPVAQDLADVSTINRAVLKDSPVLFETEAYRVEYRELAGDLARDWPADYRITTSTGLFYTDHLVVSTGLGRELDLSFFDDKTRKFFRSERDRAAKDPTIAPIFDSVAGYFRYKEKNGRAFENYSNERVLLIGAGDSGNTFVEDALGFGPEGSYNLATAQSGRPSEVVWAGQDKKTCEELLNSLRSRYSGPIVGGVRSKVINPTESKVISIVKRRDGKLMATFSNGTTDVFDRAFVATGFADGSPELLGALAPTDLQGNAFGRTNPFRESNALQTVTLDGTRFADNNEKNFTVGKRLICTIPGPLYGKPLNIYVTAPAAGRLVSDADLRGVDANVVSLFNNAPRTRALARYLAQTVQPRAPRNPVELRAGFRIDAPPPGATFGARDYRVDFRPARVNQRPSRLSDLSLKSQISAIFRRVKIGKNALPGDNLKIRVFKGGGNGFLVRIEPGLSMDDELDILARIRANSTILEELSLRLSTNNGSPQIANFELKIGSPNVSSGDSQFIPDQTKLSFQRIPANRYSAPFGSETHASRLIKAPDQKPVVPRGPTAPRTTNYQVRPVVDLQNSSPSARLEDNLIPLRSGGFVISDTEGKIVVYSASGEPILNASMPQRAGTTPQTRSILELKDGKIAVATSNETLVIDPRKPEDLFRVAGRDFTEQPQIIETGNGSVVVGYPPSGGRSNNELYYLRRFTAPNDTFLPNAVRYRVPNYDAESLFFLEERNIVFATGSEEGIIGQFLKPFTVDTDRFVGNSLNFSGSRFVKLNEEAVLIAGKTSDGRGLIYKVTASESEVTAEILASELPSASGSRAQRLDKNTIAVPTQSGLYFVDNAGEISGSLLRGEDFRSTDVIPIAPDGGLAIIGDSDRALYFVANNYRNVSAARLDRGKFIDSTVLNLRNGTIAVAADDGKIRIYDPKLIPNAATGTVRPSKTITIIRSPSTDQISRAVELSDGTIAVSTTGKRVYSLKPSAP